MAVLISQKFLLFSQVREAPGRLLSAFVDFHLPPGRNNIYAIVAYPATLQLSLEIDHCQGRLCLFSFCLRYSTKQAAVTQINVC